MHIIPTYKSPFFVALFVDATTGVPCNLSSAPTLVGKRISSWGPVDWFSGTMVSLSDSTGAYVYHQAPATIYDGEGYMAWPQWSDTGVRLAFFDAAVYATSSLANLDTSVGSRLASGEYTAPPSLSEIVASVWAKQLPSAGQSSLAAGLAALVDALLSWSSAPGTASGNLAVSAHSCQASGDSLSESATPSADRCGGYCNWSVYLYFTLNAPIMGVTAGLLDFYKTAGYGSVKIAIELSADPPDPLVQSDLNGRTFSDPIVVEPVSGHNQIDITSLLTELDGTAPGGTKIGIRISVDNPPNSLSINSFEPGYEAALSIEQTVQTPEPSVPAIGAQTLEGEETILQALRLIRAGLVGNTTGGGTNTHRFKSADGSKDRITATVDSAGNRTIMVDGS